MFRWITDFFARLFKDTRPEIRPGIDPFPKLDLDRLRERFKPGDRGSRFGEIGLPPTASNSPDAHELEIQSFFAGELTTSARIVEDRLKAYAQALQGHGIGSLLAAVEGIRSAAVGDLRVLALDGANKLHEYADRANRLSSDLEAFRKKHALQRAAVYPESRLFHLGALAVFVVVETAINGYMFARGSDFGLIGGAAEAIIFSLANVGLIGFIGGRYVLPLTQHRRTTQRMAGYVCAAAFTGFVVVFNFAIAHYRAALADYSAAAATAARRALSTLLDSPLGLSDLMDWILIAAGIAFCFLATLDWFRMDDPYPGYGETDRRAIAGRQDYAEELGTVYDEASRIRDGAQTAITTCAQKSQLTAQERSLAFSRSQQLAAQMFHHRGYLEACLQTLVNEYRAANTSARSSSVPAYFAQQPGLTTPSLPSPPPPLVGDADATCALTTAQKEVMDAYTAAIEAFETVRALADKEVQRGP